MEEPFDDERNRFHHDLAAFYRQRGQSPPSMPLRPPPDAYASPLPTVTPLAAMRARHELMDAVRLSMGAYMERWAISQRHPEESSYWLIELDKLPLSREHQQMFSRGPGGRPLHFAGLGIAIAVEQAGWEWALEVAFTWRIAAPHWPDWDEPRRRVWLRIEGDQRHETPDGLNVVRCREQIDLIAYAIPRVLWGLATGGWRG